MYFITNFSQNMDFIAYIWYNFYGDKNAYYELYKTKK